MNTEEYLPLASSIIRLIEQHELLSEHVNRADLMTTETVAWMIRMYLETNEVKP